MKEWLAAPTLPASSSWLARSVYRPGVRPPNAADHTPPTVATLTACAGVWPGAIDEPPNSSRLTSLLSCPAVPAAPLAVTDPPITVAPCAGTLTVTTGATVSIVNSWRSEAPSAPVALRSEAIAWYWPSSRGVVSVALHAPPASDFAVHSPCSAGHGTVVILQIATVTGLEPAGPVKGGVGGSVCALTGDITTGGGLGSTTHSIGF